VLSSKSLNDPLGMRREIAFDSGSALADVEAISGCRVSHTISFSELLRSLDQRECYIVACGGWVLGFDILFAGAVKSKSGSRYGEVSTVQIWHQRAAGSDTNKGVTSDPAKFFNSYRSGRTTDTCRASGYHSSAYCPTPDPILSVRRYFVSRIPKLGYLRHTVGVARQKDVGTYLPFLGRDVILNPLSGLRSRSRD